MKLMVFFRKNPFIRIFAIYATGLIIAFHLDFISWIIKVCALVIICISIFLAFQGRWFKDYRTNWLFGLILSLCFLLLGIFNASLHTIKRQSVIRNAGYKSIYTIRVLEPPDSGKKYIKTLAEVLEVRTDPPLYKSGFKIIVYFEKKLNNPRFKPGTKLLINTELMPVSKPLNPREFDYSQYLARKSVWLQAYLRNGDWKIIDSDGEINLKILAVGFREKLLDCYRTIGLNHAEFGLLSAITLGYRNEVEDETKIAFSKAGVIHIMALSGFNVGIIALVLGFLLGIFDFNPKGKVFKTFIILLSIWSFAFITGLSASVIRASVMLTFVLAGKLLNKSLNPYNILFASAFFMLVVSPTQLIDAGFQLSFIAVIGIIFFHPLFYRIFVFKNYFADKVWQIFTLSFSAQLATLPVTLFYFHQFPVYFWLANIFVVPLVVIITYLAGLYLIVFHVKILAFLLGKLLAICVKSLLISVLLVEQLPHSVIEGIGINLCQAVILFILVITAGLFVIHKHRSLLMVELSLTIFYLISLLIHRIEIRSQHILTINAIKGTTAINLIAGNRNLLLFYPDSALTDGRISFAFKNCWVYHNVWGKAEFRNLNVLSQDDIHFPNLFIQTGFLDDNIYLNYCGKTMVILRSNSFRNFNTGRSLKVNAVVVSGDIKPDLTIIQKYFDFDILVIDSSTAYYYLKCWKNTCRKNGIDCWPVNENGSFQFL